MCACSIHCPIRQRPGPGPRVDRVALLGHLHHKGLQLRGPSHSESRTLLAKSWISAWSVCSAPKTAASRNHNPRNSHEDVPLLKRRAAAGSERKQLDAFNRGEALGALRAHGEALVLPAVPIYCFLPS